MFDDSEVRVLDAADECRVGTLSSESISGGCSSWNSGDALEVVPDDAFDLDDLLL